MCWTVSSDSREGMSLNPEQKCTGICFDFEQTHHLSWPERSERVGWGSASTGVCGEDPCIILTMAL